MSEEIEKLNINIDISTTTFHSRKLKNGIQMTCTYCFENGTSEGLKKRMTGYGASEELAQRKLIENIKKEQAKLYYGESLSTGEAKVQKAIEKFIEDEKTGEFISRKTGRPKTAIAIEHDIETAKALLYPYKPLMNCPLNKVTFFTLKQWKSWVDDKKYRRGKKLSYYSADKKRKAYGLLNNVISSYCNGLGLNNPMQMIENWTASSKKKTEEDVLTGNELKKFLTYCCEDLSDHNRAQGAIQTLCYLRIGELLGLKVGDYDPEERTLKIQRELIRHTDGRLELSPDGYVKTDSSLRTIHPPKQALAILDRICKGKKATDMMFLTPKGNYVNRRNYSTWVQRVLNKLEIRKSIPAYNLRATGISYALNHGASALGVQREAGHSSSRTTARYYTAIYAEKGKEASNVMGNAVDELLAIDTEDGSLIANG